MHFWSQKIFATASAILLIIGKYIVCSYPTFELSNVILLLAKLLLESERWGDIGKSPTVWKSLTLVGSCIKSRCELDWTSTVCTLWVVQHHKLWTLDHRPVKFNNLAGGFAGRNATVQASPLLTHITFLWWLYQFWCCACVSCRLSTKVGKSMLPVTLPTPI